MATTTTTSSSSSTTSSSHAPPISLAQWTQQDFDRAVQDAKTALEANEAAIKQIVDQHMRSSGRHTGQATMRGSAAQHTEMLQYEHTFWPAYQGSLLPFFREICQNAADAGASRIRFEQRQRNTMLYAGDNGSGMSFNTLSRKFLDSEVSDKRSKAAAGGRASALHPVGGFGIGRRIILFCHEAWVLRTRSYLVVGLYDRYVLHCAHCGAGVYDASACGCGGPAAAGPATRGTEMLIKKSVSKRDMSDVEKLFFSFWHVPGIEVVLNGTVAPSLAWPPAIDNVAGHFSVHEIEIPEEMGLDEDDSFYVVCTHQGIPMFLEHDEYHKSKGVFLIRLDKAHSSYRTFNPARTRFAKASLTRVWEKWLVDRREHYIGADGSVTNLRDGASLWVYLPYPEPSKPPRRQRQAQPRSTRITRRTAALATATQSDIDQEPDQDVDMTPRDCETELTPSASSAAPKGLIAATYVHKDVDQTAMETFLARTSHMVMDRLLLSWAATLHTLLHDLLPPYRSKASVCQILSKKREKFEVGLLFSSRLQFAVVSHEGKRFYLINPMAENVLLPASGQSVSLAKLIVVACDLCVHLADKRASERSAGYQTDLMAVLFALETKHGSIDGLIQRHIASLRASLNL